jgi:cell division protein FtsB
MTHDRSEMKKKRFSRNRVRTIVISAAISLLMVVALVNFVSRVAEYNEIQSRKEQLLEEINMSKDNIEELEYWLEAPMDDDYIMKFAREKLELYRADEIVFAGEAEAK